MQNTDIHDFARKLREAHGPKAEAEAAQKVKGFQEAGDTVQAENWQRIRDVLLQMRGPGTS